MFHELDVVKLKHGVAADSPNGWPSMSSTTLQEGATGTIVAVYENDSTSHAYEVEFVAPDGSTLGLLTLTESDIEPAN